MSKPIKNRDIALKSVIWGYYNNLTHKKGSVFLNGFRKYGSVITKNLVNYGDNLHLSFNLQIYPDPQDNVAVMDIDLDTDNKNFISLILFNNEILMVSNENGTIKHFGSNFYIFDLEWINVNVSITGQNVAISVDEYNEFYYTFSAPLESCSVSFGNNSISEGQQVENKRAFKVKDIVLTTEHGKFPLIPEDLIQISDN